MFKLLLGASALAPVVSPATSAVVQPVKAGLPATNEVAQAHFGISYDFPYGGPTFDQYDFGVLNTQTPTADAVYVDYSFLGCPKGLDWDLSPALPDDAIQLDEHYVGIKELNNSTSIAVAYPTSLVDVQKAQIKNMNSASAASMDAWLDTVDPKAKDNLKFEFDYTKNTYYFGGQVNPNLKTHIEEGFSNEIGLLALSDISDLLRVRVIDVYRVKLASGTPQLVRFDSEFFINPQSSNANNRPAIITNPFDLDLSGAYKAGADAVTTVGHVVGNETIDPSFLVA